MAPTNDAASQLASRVEVLRRQIRQIDPYLLASHTGSRFIPADDASHFSLAMWGQPAMVTFPELVTYGGPDLRQADSAVQALVAYYFVTADGTASADRWVSFGDLPDGTFYNHAFQGYTGDELARQFQDGGDTFVAAAARSGGLRVRFADHAFAYQPLPRVPLVAACWLGDEDFPNSFRILFDASVEHYLPTDACAILGSMLTRRIVREQSAKEQQI